MCVFNFGNMLTRDCILGEQSVPSTQRSLLEEGDSASCFNVNSVASDSRDTLKAKSIPEPVVHRAQGSNSPNPRCVYQCITLIIELSKMVICYQLC